MAAWPPMLYGLPVVLQGFELVSRGAWVWPHRWDVDAGF